MFLKIRLRHKWNILYMTNRKNTTKFPEKKLQRGDVRFKINNCRTTVSNWLDCKEVNILSNCHGLETIEISRKMKDGTDTVILSFVQL